MAEFRDRAGHEARRYGEDHWVFVRELLQNSRDAMAGRVEITVEAVAGIERVSFVDDGEGMSFDDARRFLFTLYASTKEGDVSSAGNFGVGFWSVLRFEPSAIIVRSCPRSGEGWQARLSASLEDLELAEATGFFGTQVVLERPARGENLTETIRRAVHDDAGFISSKGRGSQGLEVLVNGRRSHRDFALPPPSLSFERRGLRGVVALATAPRVDLFAHGLRVRTAADLGDLALGDEPRRRDRDGVIAQGVAAHVLLDSSRLEVLLNRGDAREGPVLRRLVRLARRELDRLVRSELDRVAPASLWRRLRERLRGIWSVKWVPAATMILISGLALGIVVSGALGWLQEAAPVPWWPANDPRRGGQGASPEDGGSPGAMLRGFAEGGPRYKGPIIDELGREPASVDLTYRPASAQPLFALFRLDGLSDQGEVLPDRTGPTITRLSGPCFRSCIDVEIGVHADAGELLLPVPSGYAVESASLRLDGRPVEILSAARGAVAIKLAQPSRGRLSYRVGPLTEPPSTGVTSWPALPYELQQFAAELRGMPLDEVVSRSVRRVAELVAYDRSPAAARRLRSARSEGADYFSAVLGVGAGDCDVQCSLLAAVLESAGVTARLAVGYVGDNGRAEPGLHAWVEASDGVGPLRVVEITGADAVAVAASPSRGGPVPVTPAEGVARAGPIFPIIGGVLLSVVLACAVAIASVARAQTRRRFVRGDSDSLQEMVRGALSGSPALADIHSLHSRPLVPLIGAPATSLQKIRELASRGRLYSSRARGALAKTVASSGETVVDGAHAVGEVVCELMGAHDLDHWQGLLVAGEATDVTRRVDEALARQGLGWRLRLVTGGSDDLTALDLGCEQVVAVERGSEVCAASHRVAVDSVHRAAFLLADEVVRHLGLTRRSGNAVLTDLARTALLENHPPGRSPAAPEARHAR